MPTIRLSNDIYDRLKRFADREMRSVTNATEYLLALQLGAANDKVDDLIKGVSEYTPPVQKIEGLKPAILDTEKVVTSFTGGLFNELPDAEEIGAKINTQELGEMDCCQHPSRPCKHWQWNVDQAGYVNVLSGRYREAD